MSYLSTFEDATLINLLSNMGVDCSDISKNREELEKRYLESTTVIPGREPRQVEDKPWSGPGNDLDQSARRRARLQEKIRRAHERRVSTASKKSGAPVRRGASRDVRMTKDWIAKKGNLVEKMVKAFGTATGHDVIEASVSELEKDLRQMRHQMGPSATPQECQVLMGINYEMIHCYLCRASSHEALDNLDGIIQDATEGLAYIEGTRSALDLASIEVPFEHFGDPPFALAEALFLFKRGYALLRLDDVAGALTDLEACHAVIRSKGSLYPSDGADPPFETAMIQPVSRKHAVLFLQIAMAREKMGNGSKRPFYGEEERHRIERRLGLGMFQQDQYRCLGCGSGPSDDVKLQRCSRCKSVWLCGKACMQTAWTAGHKKECRENDSKQIIMVPDDVKESSDFRKWTDMFGVAASQGSGGEPHALVWDPSKRRYFEPISDMHVFFHPSELEMAHSASTLIGMGVDISDSLDEATIGASDDSGSSRFAPSSAYGTTVGDHGGSPFFVEGFTHPDCVGGWDARGGSSSQRGQAKDKKRAARAFGTKKKEKSLPPGITKFLEESVTKETAPEFLRNLFQFNMHVTTVLQPKWTRTLEEIRGLISKDKCLIAEEKASSLLEEVTRKGTEFTKLAGHDEKKDGRMQLFSAEANAFYCRGLARSKLGKAKEAADDFSEALAQCKDIGADDLPRLRLRSSCLEQLGDCDGARDDMRAVCAVMRTKGVADAQQLTIDVTRLLLLMARVKFQLGVARPHYSKEEQTKIEKELGLNMFEKDVYRCSGCGKGPSSSNIDLRKCSRCKLIWLCSEDCMKDCWKNGHKEKCKTFHATNTIMDEHKARIEETFENGVGFILNAKGQPRAILKDPQTGRYFDSLTNEDFYLLPSELGIAREAMMRHGVCEPNSSYGSTTLV